MGLVVAVDAAAFSQVVFAALRARAKEPRGGDGPHNLVAVARRPHKPVGGLKGADRMGGEAIHGLQSGRAHQKLQRQQQQQQSTMSMIRPGQLALAHIQDVLNAARPPT